MSHPRHSLLLVCGHILADQGLPASPAAAQAALMQAEHVLGKEFDQRLSFAEGELCRLGASDLELYATGCQGDWTPACFTMSQQTHEIVDELYMLLAG